MELNETNSEEYNEIFNLFLLSLEMYGGFQEGSIMMQQRNAIIDYLNNGGSYTIKEMYKYIQIFIPKN